MKRILFLLIVGVLIVGCSKDEHDFDPHDYELLKEYNLLNTFDDINNVHISGNFGADISYYDDAYPFICFSGKLKNSSKIGLIIFNHLTKEKPIDIILYENDQYTVNIPYKGEENVTISYVYCENIIQNGNIFVIYIHTKGVKKISPTVAISSSEYNTYNYIFIRNNNVVKSIDTKTYSGLINWGQNFILHNDDWYLYSPSGEIITKVDNNRLWHYVAANSLEINSLEILNDFEGIMLHNGSILRVDLRKYDTIWDTSIDLSKLDRPQINETKLISKTDTHFTYELHYTEYSGNKGVIKFKVNIETGEIEYL